MAGGGLDILELNIKESWLYHGGALDKTNREFEIHGRHELKYVFFAYVALTIIVPTLCKVRLRDIYGGG